MLILKFLLQVSQSSTPLIPSSAVKKRVLFTLITLTRMYHPISRAPLHLYHHLKNRVPHRSGNLGGRSYQRMYHPISKPFPSEYIRLRGNEYLSTPVPSDFQSSDPLVSSSASKKRVLFTLIRTAAVNRRRSCADRP